jgi:(p)ppGpp synthase/HD superfamily hydrolase
MNTTEHEKLKGIIRNRLAAMAVLAPVYYDVIKAFNFAEDVHIKKRKCGKISEFYHQVSLVGRAMQYHHSLARPHIIYITLILHDTIEDHPETTDEICRVFPAYIAYVFRMSKISYTVLPDSTISSVTIPRKVYFRVLGECEVCSVCKGFDREHNLSTMAGVFDLKKQIKYAKEVETDFTPMLKAAKRKFPHQELIYEALKSSLNIQAAHVLHYAPLLIESGVEYKLL